VTETAPWRALVRQILQSAVPSGHAVRFLAVSAPFRIFDPLLPDPEADAMLRLCERFGSYRTYAEDVTASEPFAPEIPQRYDAAANFVRSGGRFGRREPAHVLASRTNYFRATYAYETPETPGIEPFLHFAGFVDAARTLHGRPHVVPNIVYANLLLPGQELAVHTDVPEFRGANRKRYPQWLIVVMHHSGLFERWRMPIATGVAYFGTCEGGEFAFYPDGPDGAPRELAVKHNTAVLLDTDSVFHGVDRVAETVPLPAVRPGAELRFDPPSGDWRLTSEAGEPLATYRFGDLRFSVSWKAYCYADEAERRAVDAHGDDLALPGILDALERDLRARGALTGPRPKDLDFGHLLIDTYVRFPAAARETSVVG
jgi:hypothetical protein